MVETSNFRERVDSEKMSRIGNLPTFSPDYKRDEEGFLNFFANNGINIDSLRLFLDTELENEQFPRERRKVIIEWMITLLSLNEWKEEIVSKVLERWPFDNPRELAQSIAEYIKNKMSYDAITALFSINEVGRSLNTTYLWKIPEEVIENIFTTLESQWISIDDSVKEKLRLANESDNFIQEFISLLLNYYNQNDKIWFNEYHLELFRNILSNLKTRIDISELPENIQKYIGDILAFIDSNDTSGLENYFFTQSSNDNDFSNFIFGWLLREMWYGDLISLWNNTEIADMLQNVRTWVCRHYSIMMREIYNEIISRWEWINFSWESEMLYVLNHSTMHAYNILMIDWEEQGQYLDVTSFITWRSLLKKPSEIKNIKWEVWANNLLNNTDVNRVA